MNEEVRDHNGLIGMHRSLLMFVHLREEGTDLHVSLALVLQHFQLQGGISWIVEVVLDVLAAQVVQAVL